MKDADKIACPACGLKQRFAVSAGGAFLYLKCRCGVTSKIPKPKGAR